MAPPLVSSSSRATIEVDDDSGVRSGGGLVSGVGRELVIESASQATEASSMKESRARCTTRTHTQRERERERRSKQLV